MQVNQQQELMVNLFFSQLLISCLLRLTSTQIDNNELINCCKNQYDGNDIELNNIREF